MKFILKNRIKKFKSQFIEQKDIENANKILFASFSQYGDAIISYQVIKEFIKKYPNKKYLLITTKQHYPYAKEILPNIEIYKFNKRNLLDLLNVTNKIRNFNADLGFNPLSHGDDSKYIVSFAKKFFYFGDLSFEKIDNLYNRVRIYLHLPYDNKIDIEDINLNNIKQIIFAPYSTGKTKNLSEENIKTIINLFKDKDIILAIPKDKDLDVNIKKFFFTKKNSNEFLVLMKKSDLFIGVDSGPLHIAIALNKQIIGIFGPTSPLTILNNKQKIKIIRSSKLKNFFCYYKECQKPKCIENIINQEFLKINYELDDKILLITDECVYER